MRLLKIDQVKDKSGLCKTAIYEKMNDGTFPKQIKIGRNSRWLEADIDTWIEVSTHSRLKAAGYRRQLQTQVRF